MSRAISLLGTRRDTFHAAVHPFSMVAALAPPVGEAVAWTSKDDPKTSAVREDEEPGPIRSPELTKGEYS